MGRVCIKRFVSNFVDVALPNQMGRMYQKEGKRVEQAEIGCRSDCLSVLFLNKLRLYTIFFLKSSNFIS